MSTTLIVQYAAKHCENEAKRAEVWNVLQQLFWAEHLVKTEGWLALEEFAAVGFDSKAGDVVVKFFEKTTGYLLAGRKEEEVRPILETAIFSEGAASFEVYLCHFIMTGLLGLRKGTAPELLHDELFAAIPYKYRVEMQTAYEEQEEQGFRAEYERK